MLDPSESENVKNLFRATHAQVSRDHAISHVLAVLQRINTALVFFGGTALARTFLTAGRLSEDIDLYSADRQALCWELDELPEMIEQEFPRATWDRLPSLTSDSQNALLICDPCIQINVQVVDSRTRGWSKVPTTLMEIHQRYTDVSASKLLAPTFDGFVAMKALAWFDRRSARDLFDLEGLSHQGEVTQGARELIDQLIGFRLSREMMMVRVVGLWHEELAHQTKLNKTEDECLERLLRWWG